MNTIHSSKYIHDITFARELVDPLTREEFTAKYFPKYATPYSLPTGIRLNGRGRVMMGNNSHRKAQETKRANVVTEHYTQYLAIFQSEKEQMASYSQPTLHLTGNLAWETRNEETQA